MQILYFVLIGIVAGWLAGVLMKGGGFGLVGNLVLGIIGSIVGGFTFSLLGLSADSTLGSLITATVGAILFIALLRVIKKA